MSAVADLFRLRVCFGKTGRLRHLSHLETIKACERSARRAGLPYAVSQGFTPRMRIAFGPALPVASAGEREYYDLWLTRYVPADEVRAALAGSSVPELAPGACGYVSQAERSLAAELTIALYDIEVEGGPSEEDLARALETMTGIGTFTTEHKGKQKVFDLADALPKELEVMSHEGSIRVRMAVRMGERGSLRPEVFVRAAAGQAAALVVTRTDLLIEDEGVWRRPL